MAMGELPPSRKHAAHFRPIRPASRRKRRFGYLIGSAAWVVGLVVLAVVVNRADAVGFALAIVAASFVVGTVASALMRRGRLREERTTS
jgi:hypothetical protein